MKAGDIEVKIIGEWNSADLTKEINNFLESISDCDIVKTNYDVAVLPNGESGRRILRTYEIIYKKK